MITEDQNGNERIIDQNVEYGWYDDRNFWERDGQSWDEENYIKYKKETKNILVSAGEYIILANSLVYQDVESITGITEVISDSGVGTILKKEFRYSIDSVSFSEFQELTTQNLTNLGSFDKIWFQFRYLLLSGGPVTITKVSVVFTSSVKPDTFEGYVAPVLQDESRIYAFPITYKSNFLWEPYKMNRAVRLYKDLNLMVNNLFGHDVTYYRALPQGRSKDVFLMEYSLYEHDDGQCVKVIVPDNVFPDNKLSMGPFGVDFEMPFEVQVDKDYFQKIFGDGSGPQKRDILYFPRTSRIYEISSSYLFRDFMNEPLYFKLTLIKWLPKSNAEQSETLDSLESYTVSAGKLFGELIDDEKVKITNPEQFKVAYQTDDPVRSKVYATQEIGNENVQNYYTLISENYYKLESSLSQKTILVDVDTTYLKKNSTYFARLDPNSTQADVQLFYSMKKFQYLGEDNGKSIFSYEGGNSQMESLYGIYRIFSLTSAFYLFENEYDGTPGIDPVLSCDVEPAIYYKYKTVQYKAINQFTADQDRSYSAWFKIKTNTNGKTKASSFDLDIYTHEITLNLVKPFSCFIGDMITLTRTSGTGFNTFGTVVDIISDTSIKLKMDQEIIDYTKANYSTWLLYTDIQVSRSFPRVFLNSMDNNKGIKIELYENRHFKVTMNNSYVYFTIPGNTLEIENEKWHGLFINFSNTFKQLTLNLWKMQWDPVAKIPATTDLRLVFTKTLALANEDRSSNVPFFLEPSFMDLTNVRLFSKVAETDKQVLILNQNIVKDSQWAIIIDNALPPSKMPYIGYTR